ncbi:hypothetical protein ACOQFV_24125 [Nocardiopsis changdeensis]|uniref:Integrase n=1 Tax=Nocardiopsis changdeensis TaxID=2831969 RepID=A0A975KTH8_9ACTN|nr:MULTISPECIES: hypothetical protein [Nocardiopsis]QUX26518.1 hypothetical protein KGD84_33000 [Nocardiopsis changdeensis]QYX40790.1 hypothetical protein K1J57_32850 [Nocardiopsis sp. MT53]
MRKHEVWIRLGYGKGDLCTVHTQREDGTRRSYRGKVLGWTPTNRLVLEVIEHVDGEAQRIKRGISPEDAQRAYIADRKDAERRRMANLPKATGRQVKYALSLLRQISDQQWAATPRGARGEDRPDEDALWMMYQEDISDLIDDIKDVQESGMGTVTS